TPAVLPLDTADVSVAATGGAPDIAMKPDGTGFVAVWQAADGGGGNDIGVFFQRFDGNWQKLGSATRANTFTTDAQSHPSVGIDAAGDFVVAWMSNNQVSASSSRDIYARRYGASGTAIDANEFLVNTTTANPQNDPDVAVDPASGRFAIGWYGGC